MITDDFFRARLDQMIDLRHPLTVLANRLPWSQIEAALAPAFAHKNRRGQVVPGSDLFGTTLEIAGAGISPAGAAFADPTDGRTALSQERIQLERRGIGGSLVGERRVAIF